jgi:hypothetical protein
MTCIECGIKGTSAPTSHSIPELRHVIADQNAIGTTKLLQGYMAKSWVDAVKLARVKQPYAMAKILQRSLWDTLFQKIWDTRNHILHHMPNVYRTAESTDLRERLKYYRDHGNLLLSHHDRALADHSDEAIESMGRLTRRKWVKHLDKLHAQFPVECKNREAGQRSIPSMLGVTSPVRQAKPRIKRTAPVLRKRKIQTQLNFAPIGDTGYTSTQRTPRTGYLVTPSTLRSVEERSGRGGTNPSGVVLVTPSTLWSAEGRMKRGETSPSGENRIVQVTTIPPAAHPRPAGLRSGWTGYASPLARSGPTRHSGERILDVDTNS